MHFCSVGAYLEGIIRAGAHEALEPPSTASACSLPGEGECGCWQPNQHKVGNQSHHLDRVQRQKAFLQDGDPESSYPHHVLTETKVSQGQLHSDVIHFRDRYRCCSFRDSGAEITVFSLIVALPTTQYVMILAAIPATQE